MSSLNPNPDKWLDALRAVQAAIDKLEGAVIGGVAVSARSVARFTKDIDAVCWQGDRNYSEVLAVLESVGLRPRSSDPVAFVKKTRVFPMLHEDSSIEVDISLGALPFERDLIDRAGTVSIGGLDVRVASVEDLVVLKLVAGRPHDLGDVDQLVKINPDLDRGYVRALVTQFAHLLEIPEIVDSMDRLL